MSMGPARRIDDKDEDYVYPNDNPFIPTGIITRPTEDLIFADDICLQLDAAMKDAMRAAWNGWEAAVNHQSPELEDYYMRLINLLGQSTAKLHRIAKSK